MLNNSPFVTIILPVHNGEKTLKSTLASLLNQTYEYFEILIGIDGTKDKSLEIANSFNDPRIKVFEHPKNLGLAENVNYLISESNSSSEYLAMAEQDDIYVPERLVWQIEVMENQPNVGLVSGIAEFVGNKNSVLFPGILVQNNEFPVGDEMFKYIYTEQLKVVNTCMLWRKSIHLDKKLKFNNTYGNFNVDWDYILRFSLISKIYGIPKVLVKMNRDTALNSVTTNKKAQHIASRQLIKDFRKEFATLVDGNLYNKALKNHRKIELGHNTKAGILLYGLLYYIRYRDVYFIKYINKRIKLYLNGVIN